MMSIFLIKCDGQYVHNRKRLLRRTDYILKPARQGAAVFSKEQAIKVTRYLKKQGHKDVYRKPLRSRGTVHNMPE